METHIGNTNLYVTGVLYQQSQTSLFREERCENVTLMVLTDKITGKTGHLYHELAVDKRDIEKENFWTDKPELFTDNPRVEAGDIHCLSGCGPHGTPTECNDEIDEIVGNCRENELEYNQLNPGGVGYLDQCWGLHPA